MNHGSLQDYMLLMCFASGLPSREGNKGVVAWTPQLRAVVERAKTLSGNIRALTLLHNRRGKAPDYSTVKIQWDKARQKP
jgi:hypothetical protein